MGDEPYELRAGGKGRVVIPKELRDQMDEPDYYLAELNDDGQVILTPARVVPETGE
jgi:bifunctional DNA-binding transcriptional regulator/antitoxin component of YhaV-PrlF toxin-antitoxin module